jgi:hypothetical protein
MLENDIEGLVDELREHGTDLTVEYARAVPKRLLVQAASQLLAMKSEIAAMKGALEEAMRRYPDARMALAWFSAASGLSAGEVTQEVRDWAEAVISPNAGGGDAGA